MPKDRTASVPGWYVGFQAALLQQAPRPGDIDQEKAEWLIRHQGELKKTLAVAINAVKIIFNIIVDYSLELSEMIKLGQYDWVNDDIIKHFTLQGLGKQAFDLVLVTVPEILEWLIAEGQATEEQIAEKWVTTRQVIAYLASHGLLAALIEHLLAFGATYPELQRQFLIIALGSSFVVDDGDRNYPCLNCDDGERRLNLRWNDDDRHWDETCRFLAVGK
jgi:hypothetical protein